MKKFLQFFALVALMAVPWAANAQWCTPSPSSKDGNGITNVTFGVGTETVNDNISWGSSPYYLDHRSQIGSVPAGTTLEMTLSFATGYSYRTLIWVDWNNDSTFSGTEVIWVGESSSANPTTLSVSFDIPTTQDTGMFFLRICSADMAFDSYSDVASAASANPCSSYSYGVGLDYTLHVTEAPSCSRPENLVATNVTSSGLTLGWTDALNSGATYSIDYWKNGDTTTTTVTSSTTSYDFTGLDANSLYYFVVKAVCSATEESLPLSGSFATACGGSTCDITLQLGSTDSYSNPFTVTYYTPASVELFQGGRSLGAYSSNTSVEVCGTDPVVVKYNRTGYAWGDYYENYASIVVKDGGGVTVYSGSWGDTLCTIATPCPTCIPPTDLTVVPDSNQIEFSWTPRSGAAQFIVYLNDSVVNDNVVDTFYTFLGLNANTPYTVGVQSICTGADSSSIVSVNTRTACGQITLPYFVDFNDAEYNGAWYPCWDSVMHAGTDPSVNTTARRGDSGYGMYFQGSSSQNYNLVVSPLVPTTGDNIYVRFWGYLTASSGWMKAGVMTNPHDTSTFIPMVSVVGNSWNEYEFRTDTLDPTATYYVAWLACIPGASYNTQIGRVDDVYISEAPSCARVPVVIIDTTTADAITLHWDNNGSNGYTVYYWAAGSTDTLTSSVVDTTATLSGLQSMTAYGLYVVANCTGGDAEPSPVYTAATTCADATCNFTAYVTDSYNDSWNGCGINIVQAGVTVATIECPSGQSGSTFTYEVCSSAPVTLTFTRGSYPTELGGYIQDGGSNTVFTIGSMGSYYTGDTLVTVAVPCPNCVPPSDIYLSDTTASGVTIHWTAQAGQTNWIVRVDSTDYNVTDTFYIATGLAARTAHTIAVATDCSGDTSTFVTLPFITGCASGECEITVSSTSGYTYSNNYDPVAHVYQNGCELAVVSGTTEIIGVCTGMQVDIIYGEPQYTYSYYPPVITVLDGGDEEVFNSNTSTYSEGDTVVTMLNPCPSCLKPTGVTPSVVDSTQLTFIWDIDPSVTNYMVSFDNGAYTVNNTGLYTAYGLNPNTLHTFAVKAVCQLGDTSNARIVNVKTACGEMAIPYVESFEGDAFGNVPSCWTVVSDGANGFPKIDDNGHTGNQSLTFVSTSSDTAMIASGAIPLPGDSIKVSFWAFKDYGYGNFEAGVMTNPYVDSTFTSLVTITSSDYAFYEFNTNTMNPAETYYLAFRYAYNNDYYYAKVDDINITLDEGCMTPTNLTATPDTVSTDVDLTWTNTGSTNAFVIEYRLSGDAAWSAPMNSNTTSYTVTGLGYSSLYEFRVGLVCGSDTLWAPSTTASTICGVIAVPYFEPFVGYNDDDPLPVCWTYTSGVRYYDGGAMWGAYSGNGNTVAVVPQLDATPSKLQVSFDAKLWTSGDGVLIGVADAAGNLLQWLDTLTHPNQSQAAYVNMVAYFPDYNLPAGAARVAFGRLHNGEGAHWAVIDNINIIELTNCYPVDSLKAHNLDDLENTTFSWTPKGSEDSWQVYYDTVTVTLDSVENMPATSFIPVTDTFYTIPTGTIIGGGIYNFFVRANCGGEQSNWQVYEFGAGSVVMNTSNVADTVTGCGMVIYDNGGPVAGYVPNSQSALVVRSENAGMELEVFGGKFGFGSVQATLTIYDGEGTDGTVLYTYNTVNGRDTLLDTSLAVSTTGALTITFSAGIYVHTGYELYVHCVGAASCAKPTNLMVAMTGDGMAHASWDSTGASYYRVYHRISGATIWNMNTTYTNSYDFTGLPADTLYEFNVVGICSTTDSSVASSTRTFSTHWETPLPPCEPVTDVQVTGITQTSAQVSWTSTGSQWQVALVGSAPVTTTTNPYTITGLTPNTTYRVAVRNLCDISSYLTAQSEWSDTVTFTTLPEDAVMYNVVVNFDPTRGNVTGAGEYVEGTSVFLNATAYNGYTFIAWVESGDTVSHHTAYTIDSIDANHTLTAIFESTTQSIDEVENGSVTLYPNPASTAVTIRGIEGEAMVTVVDLNGREVYKSNASNTLTIDLAGYAKGAYFVRITGERTTAVHKLVVK